MKPSAEQKCTTGPEPVRNYYASFDRPDEGEIQKAFDHFTDEGINEIVVQCLKGDRAVVHAVRIQQDAVSMMQVNWDTPGRTPADYCEYNQNFFTLDGPKKQQEQRAKRLAEKLGIPVRLAKGKFHECAHIDTWGHIFTDRKYYQSQLT